VGGGGGWGLGGVVGVIASLLRKTPRMQTRGRTAKSVLEEFEALG